MLQFFTYTRHSLPLSGAGYLACDHFCDTGPPFIMVISEVTGHTPVAKRLAEKLSLPVFTPYVCRLGFEHPCNLPHARQTL